MEKPQAKENTMADIDEVKVDQVITGQAEQPLVKEIDEKARIALEKVQSWNEEAKEDFYELQAEFYSYDVEKYWAILSQGANAQLSKRRTINLFK